MQPLDELLRSILDAATNNRQAAVSDMEQLHFIAQDIDRVRGVVGSWIGADGQPNVQHLRARFATFGITPLETIVLFRNTAQSINNNTETPISWQTRSENTVSFACDTNSTPTLIDTSNRGVFGIIGTVQWALDADGRRAIHLNLYDKDDILLTGVTLHSLLPTGLDVDTLPFAGGFWFPDDGTSTYPTLHHTKFTVIHTAGAALNVNSCTAFMFRLR